jgi:methylmalonyl-CoA epimerase
MLGDVIELSVVVRDLEAAAKRYEELYGLKVHSRSESAEFGFKNALLSLGKGHIELMEPTDPNKAVARFLEKHGEGVYLVGFDVEDVPGSVRALREKGVQVAQPGPDVPLAWVHPRESHGVFVEMRRPQTYG